MIVPQILKKEQEVLGGKFQKENYLSKRIWATARDGKKSSYFIGVPQRYRAY